MSCAPASILTLDDGTLTLVVPGNATVRGTFGQADAATGSGVIEYADGSVERWTRFEAWEWTFAMSGPEPSGLWDLDLDVPTWQATFPDPDSIGATVIVDVIPARPQGARKDINTADRDWTLVLREVNPR